jgi:hypothetical protein
MTNRKRQPRATSGDIAPDLAAILEQFEKTLKEEDESEEPSRRRLFCARCGIYAFYDYAGEPIYVGQTKESLRTRIRRHMTNQRTDAVAMRALDPLEVAELEIWPFWAFQATPARDDQERQREIGDALDAAEYTVYEQLLSKSAHRALLNEKIPKRADPVDLPRSYRFAIVPDSIRERLDHPDTRLARRTQKLAEMAQIFTQRKASLGLRYAMIAQAKRVLALSEKRFEQLKGAKTQKQVLEELERGEDESS